MLRRLAAGAAAACFAVLAGCGGGGSGSSGTDAPVDADVVITAVGGIQWDSDSYAATATDGRVVVNGRNNSGERHNLYVRSDADKTLSPQFIDLPRQGSSGSQEFALAPGTYTVICQVPGHANMKATLTVS